MKSFRYVVFIAIVLFIAGVAPAQDALHIDNDGEVGIGTNSPAVPLHVVTAAAPNNTVLQVENNGPARFRFRNNSNGITWNVGHVAPAGTGLVFSDVGDSDSELLLDVNGNLTITGTLTAGNPADTFPDYVFAEDYQLMSLDELGKFVKENQHLPNIPSAGEVAAAGKLNISEFQYRLLEKIEELTLYTLQQQQNIEELRAQIKQLQERAQ
jgi:hypothetical protein